MASASHHGRDGAALAAGLEAAIADLTQQRAEQARHRLVRLAADFPAQPDVRQLLAAALLVLGDHQSSLAEACEGLRLRPRHVPTLLIAAEAALALGQAKAACGYFEAALTRDPSPARVWLAFGKALAAAEDERAPAAFAEAGRRDPALSEVQLLRAEWYVRHGQSGQEIEALELALAGNPDQSAVWFRLGLRRQDLGRLEAAVSAYRSALERQPDMAEAAVNLGIVLQDLRRFDEAMAAFRQAYRTRSDTLGRIAQSLSMGSVGRVYLVPSQLRADLEAGPATAGPGLA